MMGVCVVLNQLLEFYVRVLCTSVEHSFSLEFSSIYFDIN